MTDMQDDDIEDFDEAGAPPARSRLSGAALGEAWRTSPLFKGLVILLGLIVIFILFGLSGDDEAMIPVSDVTHPSQVNSNPLNPDPLNQYYADALEQKNQQTIDQALQTGGSAIPQPTTVDVKPQINDNLDDDPLANWRRSLAEAETAPPPLPTGPARPSRDLTALSGAMRAQMQQLIEAQAPRQMVVIPVTDQPLPDLTGVPGAASGDTASANPGGIPAEVLQPAGVVVYGQLLTEANTDVPAPIIANVLSGRFAGGKLIGKFVESSEFLTISFNRLVHEGKEYDVEVLAVDPDTTLAGFATEVDHRYFARVLLPAAATFVSEFGKALSERETTTFVSGDTVVQDSQPLDTGEALTAGAAEAADVVADFLKNEADQTRRLVRVAPGTAMGLLFLSAVEEAPTL